MIAESPTATDPPVLEQRPVDEGVLFEGITDTLSPAQLAARLAHRIAEHLVRAAWWPEDEARSRDRLGEFSSYSIGFKCRDFRTLYVRVESEPYCEGTLEISASEGDPDLATAAPDAMKQALLRRGFRTGGGRAGFVRPQRLQSSDDCRDAANAIAGLMTDCLSYDATRPAWFKFAEHQRAQAEPVLQSLSLGDVARLLRGEGLVVWRLDETGGKPGWRTVDHPRFEVYPFYETAPGSGKYRSLNLWFKTRFEPEGAEAVLREAGRWWARGDLRAGEDGKVMILQTVSIVGGVTEAFLRNQLRSWRAFLKYVVKTGRAAEVDDD